MPRSSPYTILLAPGERARLESWARKYTSPYYQVIRAKIVLLAAEGRSNKEIAHILSITIQTVKNHISGILRKLDVNDRTQAVLAGLRYGWITLDEPSLEDEVRAFASNRN